MACSWYHLGLVMLLPALIMFWRQCILLEFCFKSLMIEYLVPCNHVICVSQDIWNENYIIWVFINAGRIISSPEEHLPLFRVIGIGGDAGIWSDGMRHGEMNFQHICMRIWGGENTFDYINSIYPMAIFEIQLPWRHKGYILNILVADALYV